MVFHVCIAVITHLIRINALKLPYDLSFHCFLPFKSVNNLVQHGGNIADHSSGLQLKSLYEIHTFSEAIWLPKGWYCAKLIMHVILTLKL